jgi:hypothetical protein
MKKIALITLIGMSVLFALVLVFNPQTAAGSKNPVPEGTGAALPDSVLKFVQKTCMDCHADDGNFLAKGKVNFSSWEKYSVEKQQDKAISICKELTKGGMPTGKWLKNNPDKVPTKADIEMMCRWADSLRK